MQRKLVSHHVGARDGGISLPIPPAFEKDIINVLYDADCDSIEQISRRWASRACETRVYPYCLAETTGDAVLNINFDAYTSSLLETNSSFAGYYMYFVPYGVDYVVGEACRLMERRPVRTVGLDDLLREPEFADAPPDFLSLDTQGSEYQILAGGREALRRHVLAVYCEAEFARIYEGQKLFCDVQCSLERAGFYLAGLNLHEGFAPLRAPIGARAEGVPFGSDLLFLRKLESLEDQFAAPEDLFLALHKLAFISVLFERIECALFMLRKADAITVPVEWQNGLAMVSYYNFLRRMVMLVEQLPQHRPPSLADVKTFEELQGRFSNNTPNQR